MSTAIAGEWEAMDTPAPTYSYPLVRNAYLSHPVVCVRNALPPHAPPHFIVNLDLTWVCQTTGTVAGDFFWNHFRLRLFFKAEVRMRNRETTPL